MTQCSHQDESHYDDLCRRLDGLAREIGDLRRYVDEHDREIVHGERAMADRDHTVLNERLQLKDRWIEDRFRESDKRADATHLRLDQRDYELRQLMESEREAQCNLFDAKLAAVRELIAAEADKREKLGTQVVTSHLEAHRIQEEAVKANMAATTQRLDAIAKAINDLRAERTVLVDRDMLDTKIDAVERALATHERSAREALEAAKASADTIHETLSSRVSKNEGGINALSARLQTSVLILGAAMAAIQLILNVFM